MLDALGILEAVGAGLLLLGSMLVARIIWMGEAAETARRTQPRRRPTKRRVPTAATESEHPKAA